MTNITLDEVKKLARLAKLALTEEEATTFQAEIGAVLGYVEQLNEVDTDGVEPTSQVTGLVNSVREDELVDYTTSPDELLKNVPDTQGRYIKVRKIL